MTPTGSSKISERILRNVDSHTAEPFLRAGMAESPDGKRLGEFYQDRLKDLRDTGEEARIDDILALEKSHLVEELDKLASGKTQIASLEAGIEDISIIVSFLRHVRDADGYRDYDRKFAQRKKSRRGSLPDDEARQCFRAHRTRLGNIDRAPLDEFQRQVLDLRRGNIAIAEKAYVAMQEAVLGTGADQDPDTGK